MKKLLYLLVFTFLITSSSSSQEPINNFVINDAALVWQKIIETSMTFNELTDKIKDSGIISNLEIRDNKISGDLKPVPFDYEGAGYKRTTMGIMYMMGANLSGFVVLDFKEGKYRVTVKSFKIIDNTTHSVVSNSRFDHSIRTKSNITKGEDYTLNRDNTEYKSLFIKSHSFIWDFTLSKVFTLKEIGSENW